MPDFNNQWIEIFRAGDYGEKGKWTPDQLHTAVANFKSGAWKPPAVLGHPKNDSPAMGWVEDLRVDSDVLKAKFAQVQPELEGYAASGRFPNRSAAFYLDPQGKGPVLRHVGFLGATPPEVKGLAPIKFSDGDFISIEFKEDEVKEQQENLDKSIAAGIKSFFSGLFAEKKNEPQTFTEEDVKKKVAEATKPFEERLDKLALQFEEAVKKASERENAVTADSRKQTVAAFIAARRAANQWVPAFDEAGLPHVLEHLSANSGLVKFGEAGKETEVSHFDLLKSFLEKLPTIVPTGSVANVRVIDQNMKPSLVAQKAVAYQEENRKNGITISTPEAVDAVLQGQTK